MGLFDYLTSKMLGESEPEREYGFSYGFDMHGVDLNEGVEKGIVEPLMKARREGKRYCVDFGRTVQIYKWDKYGDGTWNPPIHYIMTSDIATPDNDFEQEERNIYDFLRGKRLEEDMDMSQKGGRTL